ncbi:MAG: divergent polysaccharide deacetylase family protein [Bacillota bacterium]
MHRAQVAWVLLMFASVLLLRTAPAAVSAFAPQPSHGSVFCDARPVPGQPPLLAIVIDDLTNGAEGLEEMLALPYPLTFAILPDRPDAGALARRIAALGHEVILHLPMDAGDVDPQWYVGRPISSRQSDEEIRQLVSEWLAAVPEARGMNNHMGTVATQDERVVRAVLEVARRHGKYILDSMTTENTVVPRTAVEMGVPCVQRSLFLDHENGKDVVVSQLYKLAEWAETHGAAIGIGHVGVGRGGTAAALAEVLPELEARGIRLVTLSQLLAYQQEN